MTLAPRTFLLTVYESPSAVLEDLATGRHTHVADIAALGEHVAKALAATPMVTPHAPASRASADPLPRDHQPTVSRG